MRSRESKEDGWKTTWCLMANIIACAVVVLLGTYVAEQYYIEYNDEALFRDTEAMKNRPNAPGSAAALLEKYGKKCWMDKHPLGYTDAVILRKKPYEPYIYTKKQRLIDRALKQAVDKKDQGLDRVLMFCTDDIIKPKPKGAPEIKLSF